jgi:hypothetical protein
LVFLSIAILDSLLRFIVGGYDEFRRWGALADGAATQEEQGIARVPRGWTPRIRKGEQSSTAAWRDLHRVHLHAIAWDRPAVAARHVIALELNHARRDFNFKK